MTIKRRWTTHVPLFGDIPRCKILNPGYAEHVKYVTYDDEGKGHVSSDAILRVLTPDHVALDILIPGTLSPRTKNPEQHAYTHPHPDKPGYYSDETGLAMRLHDEGVDINTHFPDIYLSERDRLIQLRPKRKIFDKPEIDIFWEPTLPPQSRK